MKNFAVCIAVLFALSACHNPKSTAIPADADKWETELKQPLQQLSETDRQTVAAFLVRAKFLQAFGKETLITPGLTIGGAIEEQNKWAAARKDEEAAQEALKKKLLAEQAEIQKQIQGLVTVTVLSKTLAPSNPRAGQYGDRQEFKLGIENKGAKPILGVKGTVHFYDIFDKEQGRVGFSFDDGIEVGESKIWEGSRDYNQFMEAHKSLANLEEGKYHTKFVPEAIIFKDGTKITMP
ncbi:MULTISPECIES: hypothetical protein [unclassified Duganella]|uniref:hypothetical protein n=1 Tax=unclassified Duganella TaxID=2636909 RepID=UPI0008868FF6|nr:MULTISPECIES: hypothetical protein [unclassified Duganella]SDF80107.1 hypothetical protein SAMN05216320_1011365 [Duganella sp. OV458]SDI49072.1 hypothetical protein SAMN05428973_10150 [Duganella sp. OV510]